MITSKKFWVLVIFVLTCGAAQAQSISVKKDKEQIKGSSLNGYSIDLNGTSEEVSSSFTKYIKTFAKIKLLSSPMQLSDVQAGGTTYASPFYATASGKKAWIGLNEKEWPSAEEADKALASLEKVMYDFGVKFYRDKVQVDIDEAVRAQLAAEKQQQRLVSEDKDLKAQLDFNQKEKIRLEKALADNKLQYETLLKNIDKNKKSQDSVAIATDQIKKMVEVHKERQKKIN
jgi:hypothetical protein